MKKLIIKSIVALLGFHPAMLALSAGALLIISMNPIGLMFLACSYIYIDFIRSTWKQYRESLK